MSNKIHHHQVSAAMTALSKAKIINLEAPISSLVNPVAESLMKSGVGTEVGLHILCCNEYFLVTGLQSSGINEVAQLAESIRSVMKQGQ